MLVKLILDLSNIDTVVISLKSYETKTTHVWPNWSSKCDNTSLILGIHEVSLTSVELSMTKAGVASVKGSTVVIEAAEEVSVRLHFHTSNPKMA